MQDKDDSPLALKIMIPEKYDKVRTQREIAAIKKCNCPYIGKFHYEGTLIHNDANYYYNIEEYFDGGTLTQRIAIGKVDCETVNIFATCLLTALEKLKELKLVHRDIKPDNIMFIKGSREPSLVDFGIVRDLSESSLTPSWAPQGPGTPIFSAPEQLNNDKHMIGWKTDQFSIGLILGLCLTGKHPYQCGESTLHELIDRIANRQECCDEFKEIVVKMGYRGLLNMLSPWPIKRYSDIELIKENFKT